MTQSNDPDYVAIDITSKMGVLDAREKPFEYAWLASGDSVIAALWGEYVSVGANGRWFYLESLNAEVRGGGERQVSECGHGGAGSRWMDLRGGRAPAHLSIPPSMLPMHETTRRRQQGHPCVALHGLPSFVAPGCDPRG